MIDTTVDTARSTAHGRTSTRGSKVSAVCSTVRASSNAALAASISAPALALFEHVAKHRKGLAMSEARDGHCMQCHVRLRPQVYNDLRRNEQLIQCESCSRILYFIPAAPNAVSSPS